MDFNTERWRKGEFMDALRNAGYPILRLGEICFWTEICVRRRREFCFAAYLPFSVVVIHSATLPGTTAWLSDTIDGSDREFELQSDL